jgi:hypothetical protein
LSFDLLTYLVSARSSALAQPWARQEPSAAARIAKLTRRPRLALQLIVVIAAILSSAPTFASPAPGSPSTLAAARATTVSRTATKLDAKLILRVYNYARLDPVSMALSEKVASAIFENVGIEVVWMDCSVSKPPSRPSPACQSRMGPTDLVLRILPRHMAIKLASRDEPLGSAQACTESEPACEVNVFYHRVDKLGTQGYRAERVLGYVIAHEVAHVLLGPRHSEEGILRGEWTRDDLERISWGLALDFTKNQSRQLRDAVLRRMGQSVPDDPTRANLVPHDPDRSLRPYGETP